MPMAWLRQRSVWNDHLPALGQYRAQPDGTENVHHSTYEAMPRTGPSQSERDFSGPAIGYGAIADELEVARREAVEAPQVERRHRTSESHVSLAVRAVGGE